MMRRLLTCGVLLGTLMACGREPAGTGTMRVTLPLALAMSETGGQASAVFGAGIDTIRITVSRQNESTAAQATIAVRPSDDEFRIALDVPVTQAVESLYVYVDLYAAGTLLYYTNAPVVVRNGAVPPMPPLPLTYFGPGSDAIAVFISPRTAAALTGDTLFFSATAQGAFQGTTPAPIAWAVSDAALATIDMTGRFIARSTPGSVWVRAFTPTGVADSVLVPISARAR